MFEAMTAKSSLLGLVSRLPESRWAMGLLTVEQELAHLLVGSIGSGAPVFC